MKSQFRHGLCLFATLLTGCFATASATHSLVRPGELPPGQKPATINVATNVSVIIIDIDGIPGPNAHQIDDFPSVYNNTFTQAASVAVKPGQHHLRVACLYQPGTFDKARHRIRTVVFRLEPGEDVFLFAPEQEKAKAQGKIYPRTPECPIRAESSLGRQIVLPDTLN